MLRIFAAVIVIISVSASSDTCEEPLFVACPRERFSKPDLETREDLLNFCRPNINFLKCGIKYQEECNENPNDVLESSTYLNVFEEVCNQDTLLHEAVVANLKCFNDFVKERSSEACYGDMPATVEKLAEGLREEGLLAHDDDEDFINSTYACIHSLQETACVAAEIEGKCGTIAMETFVEIILKLTPVLDLNCEKANELLPVLIRIHKLKRTEEQRNIITKLFRKRK